MRMAEDIGVYSLNDGFPTKLTWWVGVNNSDGTSGGQLWFKGEDAQKRAYEYAARLLGKKDGYPEYPKSWIAASEKSATRDRVIQRLTSSIMYGLTSTTPPYAGQTSEFVTGLIDSLTPPSPWISVKERMPEDSKPVLCRLGGQPFHLRHDVGYWMGGAWSGARSHAMLASVTHWMPLPDPPKE